MNLNILHISDLHRDPDNPIRNDVLLDSLENDRRHYSSEETPVVRSPDLILVSGDIVHGVRPEAGDPERKLREQYQEALEPRGAPRHTPASCLAQAEWLGFLSRDNTFRLTI